MMQSNPFRESDELGVPRKIEGRRPAARARWHGVERAAYVLGVTKRTVRRKIREGTLTALYRDGQWRVLIVDTVSPEVTQQVQLRGAPEVTQESHQNQEWQSLMGLVRELQRTNMELAGQVGYLQGQLKLMQERMTVLEEPAWKSIQSASPPPELENLRSTVNSVAEQQQRHETQLQEKLDEMQRSMSSLVSTFDDRLEYRNLLLYDRLLASSAEERERRGLRRRLFRR